MALQVLVFGTDTQVDPRDIESRHDGGLFRRTRMRQKRRALTRSQFRFMTVDCRSNQMNAGSFANNLGLLAR
ncbi:hypothetical protein, partial [Pseudomonas syringae]|uniref:hypothetical protein n=1 Tax=Pseudomonas syringae TaxID=317 RepID=UPI001F3B6AB1